MKAQFFDRQDAANPLNGKKLEDPAELQQIIQSMQQRTPFVAELIGENGRKLMLGLGSADGCVQFSSNDGAPPYLMAVGKKREEEGDQDFWMGDTPSPVRRRYCLPMRKVAEIAVLFLKSGERAPDIEWEEI